MIVTGQSVLVLTPESPFPHLFGIFIALKLILFSNFSLSSISFAFCSTILFCFYLVLFKATSNMLVYETRYLDH